MASLHPLEFHAPWWHEKGRTPVVEGKYYDRTTGEVRAISDDDHQEYQGPPSVDVVVKSQHIDTVHCTYRAARAFPMEALLCYIMKVVGDRKLGVDCVMATTYAIRITLSHDITPKVFSEIADEMVNGIWNRNQ